MAIIVSGGDTSPVVTAKRKKRPQQVYYTPPAPEPVAVVANLNNLNAAHLSLTGKYASPAKAQLLLSTVGNKPFGVEDWKSLLDPERLLEEVLGIPTVEEAQYAAGKAEAQAEPGFYTGAEAVPGTKQVPRRGGYVRVARPSLSDPDDIDPVLEVKGKIETFGTTGQPVEWTPAATLGIGKIEHNIDYLSRAQREARDVDISPADRGRHDVIVGNMHDLAVEISGRRSYLGLDNNFDPEDPYGKGIVSAYRELIGYSQLAPAILGTPKQKAQALKTITAIYQLEPGEDPQEIIDAVAMLPETLIRMGVPDSATLELCYKSSIAGRPFGQSELKARWDYIFNYGRDKLTPEAEKLAASEEGNINTFMGQIAKYDPGGVVTKIMDFADPLDGLHERYKDKPGAAATAVDVLHWFSHSVTHMDVNALIDRPLIAMGNMAELAIGDYDIVDGQLVHTDGLEETKFGNLFAAEAWQAAWDASEGKMFLSEASARTLHNFFGVNVEEHPVLAEALLYAGYIQEIAVGAAIDNLVMPVAWAGAKKTYKGAHRASERYAAMDAGERQRGSFTVGGKGDDLADVSVTEEGVSGQQALVTEGERITGDTQLGMGAIDQDVVAPAAKPKTTGDAVASFPVGSTVKFPFEEAVDLGGRRTMRGTVTGHWADNGDLKVLMTDGREITVNPRTAEVVGAKPKTTDPQKPAVAITARGEEAEAWLTDIAGDARGGDFPLSPESTQRLKFHPDDVTDVEVLDALAAELDDLAGDPHTTLRAQFAIDEAKARALKEMGIEVRKTDLPMRTRDPVEGAIDRLRLEGRYHEFYNRTMNHLANVVEERGLMGAIEAQVGGLTDAEVAAAQASREAALQEANAAFDQLPVAKSADGVKVKRTSVGEVDSTIAADVELLNREGYKTFGSHGYAKDHPKAHPAKDIDPYVEFDKSDLVRSADDIKGERADIEAELEQLANEEMLRQADAEMLAKAEIDAPKTPDELMKWLRLERIDYGEAAEAFVDKTLGGDKLAPYRQFKGTLASKKQRSTIGSFDEVAAHVADHFPWFGITDSDQLFAFISGYKKGTKLAGKATIAKRTKELMARLEALDKPSARANERFRAIASAAKKTGMKLEKSTADGRTLILVKGKNLHDFVEALTGKPVEPSTVPIYELPRGLPAGKTTAGLPAGRATPGIPGGTRTFRPVGGPPPPPAARLAGLLEPPSQKGRVHWLLWNRAEVVAYHTGPGTQPLIKRLFNIPDVEEFVPFLDELAAATTPDTVISIIERMQSEGAIPRAFDPTMSGIVELTRAAGFTKGLKAGPMRLASTPAGLEGMHQTAYHADQLVLNLAYAFKMGRKQWGDADRKLAMEFANRALRAPLTERQFIVQEFCRVIEQNMRAEGTWAKYEKFQRMVRRMRGKGVAQEFGRAYTKNQRIVPAGTTRRLHAEIAFWEKAVLEAADEADLPALQARLKGARQQLADYKEAADIINGKKAKFEGGHDMEWAEERMDALGTRVPFLVGEHANTIRLPFDPRVMGWFHAGAPARAAVWIDAHGFDALMRTWKMYVMGAISFPMRVFGKDEGMRLFAEGILVDPRRFRAMRETLTDLLGGQVRGGRWRKLSKAESDELNDLIALSERAEVESPHPQEALATGETPEVPKEVMTTAQFDRMTELKGKAEGSLKPEQLLEVEGEGAVDWVSALSDSYQLLVPGDPGYYSALLRNLRKMSEEPIVRAYLKTNLKSREDIRLWMQAFLSAPTEESAALRLLMAKDGVITAKQATPKGLRALYRSQERTGSAANLRTVTENWVDTCWSISVDTRLRNAVKRPGSVPISELRKVDTKNLWTVPVRDDAIAPHGIAGWQVPTRVGGQWALKETGTWNPLRVWYEQVTLRYMESISNRMRRVLFADSYGRELRGLLDDGVPLERAQRVAFERGMRYTNSRAFTRNPTILEDVLRNYIPFVNSYRQFWRYWLQLLARHPYAMTAAYQSNPARDDFGRLIDQYTVFGIPSQTFWQESQGGISGILKSNTPNVTPWLSMLASGLAERSGIKITGLPGFAEDSNFNPLSSFKALAFALHMEDSPLIGELVGDMEGYQREHAYHLKEFAAGKGEAVDESGTVETDWPALVDLFSLGGRIDRPEFLMQAVTRIVSPAGTTKLTPQREQEIRDGMRLIGDPTKLAQYRATHPLFDVLQRYYEGTALEKEALAQKYPWVVDYSATTNEWKEGSWAFTATDYYEARARGGVQVLTDDKINQNIAAARLRHWGGFRAGDPREIAPFASRQKAEGQLKDQLTYARDWAEGVARAESGGNKDYFNDLMSQWDGQENEGLPSIFRVYAEREAKAKGIDYADYERTLSPTFIGQDFQAAYGSDYLLNDKTARDVDVQRVMTLIGAGLVTASQARRWLLNSDYPEAIEAAQKDLREEALKAVVDTAREEFFDLDSIHLRKLGVECGPKLDEAIATVRGYYYNTFKPVSDQYGPSSSEAREARLAYNAFKDKTLGSVKGGEALTGGLGERITHIPYFTHPNYASVASGPHASREQRLWNAYLDEVRKVKPNMEKVKTFHKHFTPYDESRYQEFMRVNHMMYAAAMATYLRQEMKESYSDYYQGPGNSAYSSMGTKMVSRLRGLIRELIALDKGRFGASAFADDIYKYFKSPHAFSFTALEWYSH